MRKSNKQPATPLPAPVLKADTEIKALTSIVHVMENLEQPARVRICQFLNSRYVQPQLYTSPPLKVG